MNKKQLQIILLPTILISNIWSNKGRRLYYNQTNFNDKDDEIRYHLHIISEDDIKINDWVYYSKTNQVIKYSPTKIDLKNNIAIIEFLSNCKKVIASTNHYLLSQQGHFDTELLNNACEPYPKLKPESWSLPNLSEDFIEEYVRRYNEGNITSNILVEYEDVPNKLFHTGRYNWQLKLSEDNKIITHFIKNSWNKEEVGIECQKAVKYYIDNGHFIKDKWIQENL